MNNKTDSLEYIAIYLMSFVIIIIGFSIIINNALKHKIINLFAGIMIGMGIFLLLILFGEVLLEDEE